MPILKKPRESEEANNKSHKQFFFGSRPYSTSEEWGDMKDLEK